VKRSNFRDLAIFAMLISVPFAYNSCQGGFRSSKSKSSSSTSSKSCKVMLENGKATKVTFDNDVPPTPFMGQKTALRGDTAEGLQIRSKADGSVTIEAGTELAVILNNQCLQQNHDGLKDTVISKVALAEGALQPELLRQAYLWPLERDYSDTEIEAVAAKEPCVIGVSWNHEYQLQSVLPFNDPNYSNQVHFARVKAEAAYPKFYSSTAMAESGDAVIIGVMDTGVDWQHPDLQGNFWAHQYGMGIDATTIPAKGAVNPPAVDYNPYDISPIGHGTHVAGLIAAISGNSVGTVGLMPKRAKIMAIKVFALNASGDNVTSSQWFYNGVQFAYLNKASVLNISLGAIKTQPSSDALAKAGFEEALAHGMTVVTVIGNASSGNGGLVDGTTLSSIPGQYGVMNGVITVGSIDADTGQKSYFSHYSPVYTEIAAPGAKAGSSGLYSTKPVAMGGYGTLAGTSQAAPLVSAAAGMVVGLIRERCSAAPTPAEVERLLEASANKDASLKTYFKDGNTLDLNRLADKIIADYGMSNGGCNMPADASCD
jgi:hypothetical protein